jgi:hypothetical protein
MSDAGAALRSQLGEDLEFLDLLSDEECAQLVALLSDARRSQRAALDASITKVLNHFPMLIRVPARKILFGKGN